MTAKPLTLPRPQTTLALLSSALIGSLILALSARINAPMWPVPMTMQTLALVLIAAYAGPRGGVLAVVFYLAEGVAGLPVFTAGGGPAYLAGPTGGYLIAFLPAAFLTGLAADRGLLRHIAGAFAVFAAAQAIVLIGGVSWLAVSLGWGAAVSGGLIPFLPGAAVKAALAAAMTGVLRPQTRAQRSR